MKPCTRRHALRHTRAGRRVVIDRTQLAEQPGRRCPGEAQACQSIGLRQHGTERRIECGLHLSR